MRNDHEGARDGDDDALPTRNDAAPATGNGPCRSTNADPATDLTRALYFLGRSDPEVLDVALLHPSGAAPVATLFSEREPATAWRDQLPEPLRAEVCVQVAPADDPRARAELLEACLSAGAATYLIDPAVGQPEVARTRPLRGALAYLHSLKTASACF